jgi:plasmid maintenance system antidote protein VapI
MRDVVQLNLHVLERERLTRLLSRSGLAAAAGLSAPSVERAVAGRPITLTTARKIAAALELCPAELVVLPEAASTRA